MKYPHWSQVYVDDLKSEAYDKMVKKVAELTIPSISEEDYFCTIKEETNLIYLTVSSITKEIQTFRHLTQIGGNISLPNSILVALMGFGTSSIPIRPPETLIKLTSDITIPTWKMLDKLTSPKNVLDLKPDRGAVISFCNILPILSLLSFPSRLSHLLLQNERICLSYA